jgi:hypothetical protein
MEKSPPETGGGAFRRSEKLAWRMGFDAPSLYQRLADDAQIQ